MKLTDADCVKYLINLMGDQINRSFPKPGSIAVPFLVYVQLIGFMGTEVSLFLGSGLMFPEVS